MGGKFEATFHDPAVCRRGCCWTTHGVCAKRYGCEHHRAAEKAREARDVEASLVADLDRQFTRAAQGRRY